VRLIQLIANHNRHPTGMTTVFESIVSQAAERGWDVVIAVPEAAEGAVWVERLATLGASIHLLPYGSNRSMTAHISRLLAADSQPTLVHTHLTTYDIAAALACGRRSNVVLFWHVHSVLPEGMKMLLRARLKFALLGGRVDRVVIPFENTRQDLIRRGVRAEKLVVFPGCVDPEEYPVPTSEERALCRDRMEVPDGSLLLLHFGWHWYEKGGDQFLETVRLLVDEGLPVIALVNRGGEPAERTRERLGLEEVVRIEGLVEDSRPLFVAADCMVGPSRAEGLTFTYLEALATGLPLVATNLPGEHYLNDALRACIVAGHDPHSLAAGVREVLGRSEDERAAAAAEMRSWIVAERSVGTTVTRLMDEYESAIGSAVSYSAVG
jgi:glycosyltransferase involved in cell wall biosynthesis